MIRLRSRIALSQPSDDRLVIQSNAARRILFGSIAAVLLLSFAVSSDWGAEGVDGLVAGTIFYFVVTAICLGVAGWNSVVAFDRSDGQAHFTRRLFGIPLVSSAVALSAVISVVVQGVKLLRDEEKPRATVLSNRLRGHVESRNVYYKLMLESTEKMHFLEDSTDLADLETAARRLAEFLGVSYRYEAL
jgi:hypothetical protein